MDVRVRLKFQSTPLHYAKKCFFLFNQDRCRTVGDLAYLVTSRFGLEVRGVQLFIDDYFIPPNESSSIIRDNDIIEVRTIELSHSKRVDDVDLSAESPPPVKKAKRRRKEPKDSEKSQLNEKNRRRDKTKVKLAKSTSSSPKRDKGAPPESASLPALKAVTKKSATGGVHTTFQSTSGSSSSSSSSDSEEIQTAVTSRDAQKPQSKTQPVSHTPQQQNQSKNKLESEKSGQNSLSSSSKQPQKVQQNSLTQNRLSGNGLLNEIDQSPRNRGSLSTRRARRGRGRGRGCVVGGEDDVLSVRSVVYRSPGERGSVGRGRGRGRGWESGWGVRGTSAGSNTNTDSRGATHDDPPKDSTPQEKDSLPVSGNAPPADTIWEKSKVGFTREATLQQPESQVEEEASASVEKIEYEAATEEPVLCRDYSSLPALLGAPRVGDTIAFKLLEISSSCTPEVSGYKEAEVVEYEASSSLVTLRYTSSPDTRENPPEGTRKSALLRCVLTEEEEEEEENGAGDNHVTLSLGSLLRPKLIP